MPEDIKERLETELGSALWSDLLPQLGRDQLILVSNELDLIDVGISIAADAAKEIDDWVKQGKISKPNQEQIESWTQENPKFLCLIVQPFVLIKKEV